MPGTKTTINSLLFTFALAFSAAGQDYFPLQTGNQWIYRSADRQQTQVVAAEIARTEVIDGRQYAFLTGFFGRNVWLRQDENGTLLAYDPQSKSESVWAVFSTPEGGSYRTAIHECNTTATVKSKTARFRGPIGETGNALELTYPPAQCADAGLTSEIYLPYIGLAERTETSIAGPRRFELVYARLGGVTVVSESEAGFSMTLNKLVYLTSDKPTVRFTLRNTSGRPLQLNFPSGQSFDISVRDARGNIVYVWSRDKLFTQVYRTETVSGERNFPVLLDNLTLPAGKYTAEGWLTTDPARLYSASVAFDVADVVTQP